MNIPQNTQITTFTPEVNWALTLAEAKLHLNILDTSFDDLIEDYIAAAHVFLYQETNILVKGVATGYMCDLDDFTVNVHPMESIVIKYYDSANDIQTWASSNYIVNGGKFPDVEILNAPTVYDRTWPYVIEITTAANTNPMVTQALRMIVGDLFETRQTNVMGASLSRVMSRTTEYQLSLISQRLEI